MSEEDKHKLSKILYYSDIHPADTEFINNIIYDLQQKNKQLKEQLENDIDRYEDTISYQLGFDKGKEYMQQRIDKAIEYIKENEFYLDYKIGACIKGVMPLLEILGVENE